VVLSSRSVLQTTSSTELASFVSMPTSLRQSPMTSIGQQFGRGALASLPGPSPWKELAIAAMKDANTCDRDVSMKANPHGAHVKAVMARLDGESREKLSQFSIKVLAAKKKAAAKMSTVVDDLPGVVRPWDFWDPLGLSTTVSDGKLLFYREAELKHGRVCMLATVGFAVGERFHPLWGGDKDMPALEQLQDASILAFWPLAFLVFGGIETAAGKRDVGGGELPDGLYPGDLGWDPLDITPKDPEEFRLMQNREILNGRLAMISMFGQIAEEFVTKEKLHFGKIFEGADTAVDFSR